MKTITVDTHFGEKEITQDQFINQWVEHVNQIRMINWSTEWQDKVLKIVNEVRSEAEDEFDRIYNLKATKLLEQIMQKLHDIKGKVSEMELQPDLTCTLFLRNSDMYVDYDGEFNVWHLGQVLESFETIDETVAYLVRIMR